MNGTGTKFKTGLAFQRLGGQAKCFWRALCRNWAFWAKRIQFHKRPVSSGYSKPCTAAEAYRAQCEK